MCICIYMSTNSRLPVLFSYYYVATSAMGQTPTEVPTTIKNSDTAQHHPTTVWPWIAFLWKNARSRYMA